MVRTVKAFVEAIVPVTMQAIRLPSPNGLVARIHSHVRTSTAWQLSESTCLWQHMSMEPFMKLCFIQDSFSAGFNFQAFFHAGRARRRGCRARAVEGRIQFEFSPPKMGRI